jgi:N-acetylmuramoyl-L-alanine amidase
LAGWLFPDYHRANSWSPMTFTVRKALVFSMVWIIWFASGAADAATVNGVRLWRAPDNTRLVFDLSGPVEHKLADMPGENGQAQRIVITIQDSQFNADASKVNLANTPLARFDTEKNGSELKLVIDLASRTKPKSFLLPANNQYGNRLVLDLYDEDTKVEVAITKPPANGLRDVMIAVDPGHGGEDPGAKGPGNIYEKNITLAIAKELVKRINDTPGYSAFLTRTGDYYVSLRGRTQIARNKGADLFVSIHADAFKDSSAQGAGVFALSQRGATSETARWLAQSENEADLVGGVNLGDKDPMLQEVLLDLSMTATVATSLDMGDKVMDQMKKITKMHRGYVEQAGFVVLKNPDIPSLLIETGFITNVVEARNLSSPVFRSSLAKGIFMGIDNHFRAKPPMDTALAASRGGKVKPTMDKIISKQDSDPIVLQDPVIEEKEEKKEIVTEVVVRRDTDAAQKAASEADDLEKLVAEKSKSIKPPTPKSKPAPAAKKTVTHLVKKGDTLTAIASRYKVSPTAIREQNKLPDQQVRIGQTLTIPAPSN